jgi:hypothetical protein
MRVAVRMVNTTHWVEYRDSRSSTEYRDQHDASQSNERTYRHISLQLAFGIRSRRGVY